MSCNLDEISRRQARPRGYGVMNAEKLLAWWSVAHARRLGRPVDQCDIGDYVRRMTPLVFGNDLPPEALMGFIANSSGPNEDTAGSQSHRDPDAALFHELGVFGIEAGDSLSWPAPVRPGTAGANTAIINNWARLSTHPLVMRLIDAERQGVRSIPLPDGTAPLRPHEPRSAVMDERWSERAFWRDQIAIGLVNLRYNLDLIRSQIYGEPRDVRHGIWHPAVPRGTMVTVNGQTNFVPQVLTIWDVALAFSSWSAGGGRAGSRLQRLASYTQRPLPRAGDPYSPDSFRWGQFVQSTVEYLRRVRPRIFVPWKDGYRRTVARRQGIRDRDLPVLQRGMHNNDAYSLLRTWQKLAAGEELAWRVRVPEGVLLDGSPLPEPASEAERRQSPQSRQQEWTRLQYDRSRSAARIIALRQQFPDQHDLSDLFFFKSVPADGEESWLMDQITCSALYHCGPVLQYPPGANEEEMHRIDELNHIACLPPSVPSLPSTTSSAH